MDENTNKSENNNQNNSNFSFKDEDIEKISKEAYAKGHVSFGTVQDNIPGERKAQERAVNAENLSLSASVKAERVKPKIADEQKKPTPLPEHGEFPIKTLRTYQGDIAEAIKKENESVLSITLAEKKRNDERQQTEERQGKKPKVKRKRRLEVGRHVILVTTSLVLILLGVTAVVIFYMIQKNPAVESIIAPIDETIAPFDEKVTYNESRLDRNVLKEILYSFRSNKEIGAGDILYIALSSTDDTGETPMDTDSFLSRLQVTAPGRLVRSFSDRFMLGMYNTGEPEPFLLIRLASFENAYAGMLDWEKSMYKDVGVFFSKNTLRVNDDQATSTTEEIPRTVDLNSPVNTNFEDITIKNKDARILKNQRGDVVLLYSFVDKNTLLITNTISVLQEMVNKIAASKLIR